MMYKSVKKYFRIYKLDNRLLLIIKVRLRESLGFKVLILLSLFFLTSISIKANALEGVVTDFDGFMVTTAKVTIKGQSFTKTISSIDEGKYKIELNSGKYEAEVFAEGFCPMKNGSFEILPNSKKNILNFTLVDCSLGYKVPVNGRLKEAFDEYLFPFKEEAIKLNSGNYKTSILIKYGKMNKSNGIIKYEGFNLAGGRFAGVMINYDLNRIVAYKIKLDTNNLIIEAEGNAMLERNGQTFRSEYLKLNLATGKLTTNKEVKAN